MAASYREGKAVAEYHQGQVSAEQIAQVINEKTYYRATVMSVREGEFSPPTAEKVPGNVTASATIVVEGMTDDRAASEVVAAIGNPAITDVSVDTKRSQLTIVFDPSRVTASWFANIINNKTPFKASLVQAAEPGSNGIELRPIWFIVAGAGIGAVILAWYTLASARRRTTTAQAERQKGSRRR